MNNEFYVLTEITLSEAVERDRRTDMTWCVND
jgi:hypothetical protein